MSSETPETSNPEPVPFGALQRVRYDARRRTLDVVAVEALSPRMRRIRFQSRELADFVSRSPDDHIKLFVPDADGAPVMRDYTPRSFDTAAGTLVIDFALHDEVGPATAWAQAARPGDRLEIGGPRGSTLIPDVFDWYLLVGDETALPAMGRRVEELRPEAVVTTLAVVADAAESQAFDTAARWQAEWIRRDVTGADDIENARQAIDRILPRAGEGFVWIAGEAQFARSLRAHMVERFGWPLAWMKAAGYWLRGGAGVHEPL